jgi:hypothetical protein
VTVIGSGNFKTRWVTVEAARIALKLPIVAWEATACCKIDGQFKATGEVGERSSIY